MTHAPILVVAAGGTGGHLFPAEALAREMKDRGFAIHLVTDERGESFAGEFPADEVHMTPAATFAGRGPAGKIKAILTIAGGTGKAGQVLKKLSPFVTIGFGGYPSLPTMSAAIRQRRPTALHEQNALLGRVNKLYASKVGLVACGFNELRGLKARDEGKAFVVGNPVRPAVLVARAGRYEAPHPDDPFRLLVFGGSQGARVFGAIVPEALAGLDEALRRRFVVTQQCRPEDIEAVRSTYEAAGIAHDLATFFSDLPARMAASHLVIGRAGASTISELAVIGRPSILVPLPGAMDDHQTVNARYLLEVGGAVLCPEAGFTPASLREKVMPYLRDASPLAAMALAAAGQGRPQAAKTLADLLIALGEAKPLPAATLSTVHSTKEGK
ncbi:MAG: UDP-N-acetylglucosamine--N-acetylmuramyl-(pentapeptide) pyrophosphoryl-undecaprenol N-acetylglucosamine transferase [Pseudomonadota bacterium]